MTDIHVSESALDLPDGRTLRVHDTGAVGAGTPPAPPAPARLTVFWQHGTPNVGTPPRPLFRHSARLGIRWVSYDRPGYGGSTPHPGRSVGSAATDVRHVADALGIDRFALMGHSGGASHALASAAVLRERVLGVVAVSGPAPFGAQGLDWFAGMAPSCRASLTAAAAGRAAKERFEAAAEYDPEMFTEADHAALAGDWSWFHEVVAPAVADGPGGLIDDDLAYVAAWGCDPAAVTAPVLVLHGASDRVVPGAHGEWLAKRCPRAELWLRPSGGHLSVLSEAPAALDWLVAHAHG
ncbi:alpha/beta fold hydrolase [Streptomyces collinus]|nr:alpha/beta fold hydrolase [Streptomyces collinus]UJA12601.1 alpha/beta fold hydrolase [Streptomyces collinus]